MWMRRVTFRLIVALLAFIIGVTAAIAIGGFNPMTQRRPRFILRMMQQSSAPPPTEFRHHCGARMRILKLEESRIVVRSDFPEAEFAPFVGDLGDNAVASPPAPAVRVQPVR